MNRLRLLCPIGILLLALAFDRAQAQPRALHLALQTREPKNNQVVLTLEEVDSAKVAVVIIDPWNFHWCILDLGNWCDAGFRLKGGGSK